jgi:hypothetical protein
VRRTIPQKKVESTLQQKEETPLREFLRGAYLRFAVLRFFAAFLAFFFFAMVGKCTSTYIVDPSVRKKFLYTNVFCT